MLVSCTGFPLYNSLNNFENSFETKMERDQMSPITRAGHGARKLIPVPQGFKHLSHFHGLLGHTLAGNWAQK